MPVSTAATSANLEAYIGPAAGVLTSVLWASTALLFAAAGRRLGAATVNVLRILMAVIWLGITHRLVTGAWLPPASNAQVLYLALSGLVGLTIGDFALFAAFVQIGPRLAMLMMTTAPLLAALFGALALHERLGPLAVLGMALTIAGVAWVVAERPAVNLSGSRAGRAGGLLLALFATTCQAGGSLLSKLGLGHGGPAGGPHLPALAGSFLRMFFAGAFMIPVWFWVRRVTHARRSRTDANPGLDSAALQPPQGSVDEIAELGAGAMPVAEAVPAAADPPEDRAATVSSYPRAVPPAQRTPSRPVACLLTFIASLVGPYLGVWLSLVAFDHAKLGVAQTTLSLSPVFILPLSIWVEKEHVSARAALGALVAVAGTALLFVRLSE